MKKQDNVYCRAGAAATITVAVLCCTAAAQAAGSQDTQEPTSQSTPLTGAAASIADATVLLELHDWDGSHCGTANGFLLTSGTIVTTWHGVEGAAGISVNAGRRGISRVDGIVAASEELDVVLLRMPQAFREMGAIQWAPELPLRGSDIKVVTRQANGAVQACEGVILDPTPDSVSNSTYYQSTAKAWVGCSGSPVIDAKGLAVGVVVRGDKDARTSDSMTLFVSSADIAALPPADTADLGEWLRARFGPEWTKASRIARTAAAFGESDQAKAEAQYKEALATNPRAKWVLAQYCRFLESRKRASDIEVVARSFFERQTSDPFALLLLGGAMLRLGRSEEAVRAYRKACEVSPMANSWYWLGCALWEKGDWDGMTAAFEKAIAGCSRNSPAMQVLTRYYGRNKRYEDAIRVAELWAGSFPMDENAVAALVSLYRDSGDEKRMRQAVERLRRLNPYLANRAELK